MDRSVYRFTCILVSLSTHCLFDALESPPNLPDHVRLVSDRAETKQ